MPERTGGFRQIVSMAAIRIATILIGAVAVSALIWFGGPLIAIGDTRPFESLWGRTALIILVAAAAVAAIALDYVKRRRANAAIENAIAKSDQAQGDAKVLQEIMRDALAALRRAKGRGGDYLYELPWYVIIGPPGAGKTTALANSGLRFPLARGGTPEAVAGVGGTRYCDWWFAEEAVLIDTAGRYTTQDSDPQADRRSWLSFLDLIRENRPKQPINGVIVAISLEDLLTADLEEVAAHANAIRQRLVELHEHLKVDFPVYTLLTKADLIGGFSEFFGSLTETERRMVWGHTFQTSDRSRNMISEASTEFDALVERLTDQLPDHLQSEPTPAARVAVFGFPSQVASLKRPIIDFLNQIFEPSRYHASTTLRGFYFTSGTQQGTPIDRLIGALVTDLDPQDVPPPTYSGKGKSFFLTDLLRRVVIAEAGWVTVNQAAVRRSVLLRAAAFAGIGAIAALAVMLWWISFNGNRELISAINRDLVQYRNDAGLILRETTVADRNFVKVQPLLQRLRYMPAGYASRDEQEPITTTFGLSQRERLQSAAETAYEQALERLFRSRLIYRLEEQLEANINDPGFVYEALKVYMMVGGIAPADREFVVAWMRKDWAENLFPGAANARGRLALEEHLQAIFDLDVGQQTSFSLNKALIENAQRTLARMSVAERAYELLKSQARGVTHRDWVVAARGGTDVALVFEGASGEDLDSLRVPFFYTYEGFQSGFLGRLSSVGEQIQQERWILGEAGQQQVVAAQYSTLYPDLMRIYTREFVTSWQTVLRKLKLRPLNADKPRYIALAAAGAATSPIKQLIVSIVDETRLTRERPNSTPKPNIAQQSQSGFFSQGEAPGANIEAQFKGFHVLLEGEGGRNPVDALLQNLTDISQSLAIAATNPTQAQAANNQFVQQVAILRATASRFPSPFDQMIRNAANDFEGDATGTSIAMLQQSLADQVTRVCLDIVNNRYPFTPGVEREVSLADFARLFAPSGIIDKFFKESLAPYVDQSRMPWTWRPDNRIARGLSTITLRQFQHAAEIRDAFFPTGGNLPSFTMAITPLGGSGEATTSRLEINGASVISQQGVNIPTNVSWPGSGVPRSAVVVGGGGGFFSGGFFSQPTAMQKDGAWSFFKLLDVGNVLRQGDVIVASFVLGGRQVSYQIHAGTVVNPIALKALRDFRCPSGI